MRYTLILLSVTRVLVTETENIRQLINMLERQKQLIYDTHTICVL